MNNDNATSLKDGREEYKIENLQSAFHIYAMLSLSLSLFLIFTYLQLLPLIQQLLLDQTIGPPVACFAGRCARDLPTS